MFKNFDYYRKSTGLNKSKPYNINLNKNIEPNRISLNKRIDPIPRGFQPNSIKNDLLSLIEWVLETFDGYIPNASLKFLRVYKNQYKDEYLRADNYNNTKNHILEMVVQMHYVSPKQMDINENSLNFIYEIYKNGGYIDNDIPDFIDYAILKYKTEVDTNKIENFLSIKRQLQNQKTIKYKAYFSYKKQILEYISKILAVKEYQDTCYRKVIQDFQEKR